MTELALPEVRSVGVDPLRAFVVVVDMENEFCHAEGRKYVPQAPEAVSAAAKLIARARKHGSRIVWIRSVRDIDDVEFRVFGREPYVLDGTWAVEFTPPLAVGPGEAVITKRSHDCFNDTSLEASLSQVGCVGPRWTAIVVGVTLNVCVDLAVLGFSVRNYRVVIPIDCVAPRDGDRAHATLARYTSPAYAYNVTVSESESIEFTRA